MPGVHAPAANAGDGAVRLTPEAVLVPNELLAPPWRSDSRGTFPDLAALLLDRHLRRLARIRQPIDLRLGLLLHRLDASSGYLSLGFARIADYATERLGLPARRVQTLLALARCLGDLPRLSAAFEAGRVSLSQVQLLLRVVTPSNEAEWLARAEATTVRRLEVEVRAAAGVAGAEAAGAGDTATDDPATGERDRRDADQSTEASPRDARRDAIPSVDDDPPIAGEFICFNAPAGVRARWEAALELARRSSGASDPVWRSVEYIAADYLSGFPDLALTLSRSLADRGGRADDSAAATATAAGAATAAATGAATATAGDSGAPPGGSEADGPPVSPDDYCPPSGSAGEGADKAASDAGIELFEEVLAALAADSEARAWDGAASGDSYYPDDRPLVVLPDSVRDDPSDTDRGRDAKLRELVRLRQNVSWNLGRLLRVFAGRRLHRELGFLSFSRYCRERLGLGVRRAWQLVALDRRLLLLPRIESAYRGGTISWVKASNIARVATERNEDRWLRLAEAVTVRRLIEEVALAEAGFAPSGPPGLDPDGRVQLSTPARTPPEPPPQPPTRPPHRPRLEPMETGPASGAATPAYSSPDPAPRTRIRFWAPNEVASLWHEALAVCRQRAGRPLGDGECVLAILDSFLATWSVRAGPAWRRRYRIFERDGWRCRVPGCTARRNLQVHHVRFRSRGGSDDDANLAVLCATHHLQGIHRDHVRCHVLPDGLLAWEFSPDQVDGPLVAWVEDVVWSAARAAVAPGAGQAAEQAEAEAYTGWSAARCS